MAVAYRHRRGSALETESLLAGFAVATVTGLLLLSGWMGWLDPNSPGSAGPPGAGPGGGLRSGTHGVPPVHVIPGVNGSGSNGSSSGGGGGSSGGGGTGNSTGNGSGNSSGNSSGSSGGVRPLAGIPGNLSLGVSLTTYTSRFFAAGVQTPNLTDPWFQARMLATPLVSYAFGNGLEVTDQINGLAYADDGSSTPVARSNDSAFISFCRSLHCHSMMGVPAEIDNPTEGGAVVQYVEKTLGFHPDYWGIGNEPQGWTHFGIPWTKWRVSDHSTITPLGYAKLVQRYVTAMRMVDPSMQIIGIESADGGSGFDSQWLDEVATVDGRNITAVAIHPYPGGRGTPTSTVADFYSTLASAQRFPNNFATLQSNLAATCRCHVPIFVGEYNAGLAGNLSQYIESYPEVPYMAAGYAGALKAGVVHLSYFSVMRQGMGLLGADRSVTPAYSLFSTIFPNLTVGSVWNASVLGGPSGVYAVLTTNGSHASIMVSSTNLTSDLNLTVPMGELRALGFGDAWSSWRWGPSDPGPVFASGTAEPYLDWSVPAQGVLLIDLGVGSPA